MITRSQIPNFTDPFQFAMALGFINTVRLIQFTNGLAIIETLIKGVTHEVSMTGSDFTAEEGMLTGGTIDSLTYVPEGETDPVLTVQLPASVALNEIAAALTGVPQVLTLAALETFYNVLMPNPAFFLDYVGGDGPETVHGFRGDDNLRSGSGDDTLNGFAGDDTLNGEAGNDTFILGPEGGADLVNGGDGDDSVRLNGPQPNAVNVFFGGNGEDLVDLSDVFGPVVADATASLIEFRYDGGGGIDARDVESIRLGGFDDSIDLSNLGRFGAFRIEAGGGDDRFVGTDSGLGETFFGEAGNDRADGAGGDDVLNGGQGADTLIGGAGDDVITGGPGTDDLRDVVFAGTGDDEVDGGAGNDSLTGGDGGDTIAGGAGVDTVIGNAGDDVLTGSNFSDLVFGNAGADFINGGFGHDRVNGGAGGDRFFHIGAVGHGSDWIQDYTSAQGDTLFYGGAARSDQFQINLAETANAGQAGVQEAFVIFKPTGQILWALVDGADQDIRLQIGGVVYDLDG